MPKWDVKYFMKVVTQMATSHELVALDTCDVMENVVAMSLSKIIEVGKTLHSVDVDTRLTNATGPVSHTINRNRLFTLAIVQTYERKERKLEC